MESYIHRSGRTGRAGRTGVCICFYQRKEEDQLRYVENKAVCLLLVPVGFIGYGAVTLSHSTFIAGHHFQTRWCSHCQWHHQVIKQRRCQVSVIKFDTWILFWATSDWFILSHMVVPDCVLVGYYLTLNTLMPFVFFLQVSGLYSSCSHWLLSSIGWEADWRKGSSWRSGCCSGSYLWSHSPRAEIAAQLWCSMSPSLIISLQKWQITYWVPALLLSMCQYISHDLFNCMQGYTTLQLMCSLEMHNIGYAWKSLKEQLGEKIESHIHRMTFLKGRMVWHACSVHIIFSILMNRTWIDIITSQWLDASLVKIWWIDQMSMWQITFLLIYCY